MVVDVHGAKLYAIVGDREDNRMTERTWWEKIETKGEEALEQLKRLITEGNVRRVRIRQKDHVVAEFPLTIGVVGVVLAPVVAAVGAVAALMTDCTIEVERQEK
jgi:hypothetical protein